MIGEKRYPDRSGEKMKEYLVRNRGKKSLDSKRTFPAARSAYYFLNREE